MKAGGATEISLDNLPAELSTSFYGDHMEPGKAEPAHKADCSCELAEDNSVNEGAIARAVVVVVQAPRIWLN